MHSKRHEEASFFKGADSLGLDGLGHDGAHRVPIEKRGLEPRLVPNVDPWVVERLRGGMVASGLPITDEGQGASGDLTHFPDPRVLQ